MPTVNPTYPLTPPTDPAPRMDAKRFRRVVGTDPSPFTLETDIQLHQGAAFEFDFEYPPMTQAQASEWEAFLFKMRGQSGTAWFGDPDRKAARGSIAGGLVNGASQEGNAVNLDGLGTSQAGLLLPGDMISFAGYDYMHKVTDQLDSDGSGEGQVVFEPPLRSSPADNAAVQYANVVTKMMLASSVTEISANELKTYGLSLSIKEKL